VQVEYIYTMSDQPPELGTVTYAKVRWSSPVQPIMSFFAPTVQGHPFQCMPISMSDVDSDGTQAVVLRVMSFGPPGSTSPFPTGTQFELTTHTPGKINVIAEGIVVAPPSP
jgi:hypothetical protein